MTTPGQVPATRPRPGAACVHRRRFLATPQAAALAREWAAARLTALGLGATVLDDTVLVLDELVSNVVIHTAVDTFDVTIRVSDVLTVVVADDAPSRPSLRAPTPQSESGRGMRIVERLALAWGADGTDRGKAVWARIALGP